MAIIVTDHFPLKESEYAALKLAGRIKHMPTSQEIAADTQRAAERYGALIWNTCPAKNGVMGDGAMCAGHVRWDTATAPLGAHVWTLDGAADEHLTLSPSVLCRNCNDHGFLRDGRWIRA